MITARLRPMSAAELADWGAARVADGDPLPEPAPDGRQEPVVVEVDGVVVGGALLEHSGTRCSVRVLQTTLPPDAADPWRAVVAALEAHALARGAAVLATAVGAELAPVFGAAGFRATMTTLGKRLDPAAPRFQEDRRVAVRPMDAEERRRFAADARQVLRAGMERAGVVDPAAARLDHLEARLARLADGPEPEHEMLRMGSVDGVLVGRAWATLVPHEQGLDLLGNTIELFPEHRGQGLTKSFLGALRREIQALGVRDLRLRVYGHDTRARRTFLQAGVGVADVHLRKDLL